MQALQGGAADQQVLVRFTVSPDGRVRNRHAVFTLLSPADTAAVLAALRQWRFKPAMDGSEAMARDFMYPLFFGPDAAQDRTLFFCRNENLIYKPDSACEIVTFGHWRIFRMDPVYPASLLDQHLAGSVTLSFDVNPHGQVQQPKVISATPPGAFDAAALAAVRQWYFEPLQEQKDPPPEQHVTVTVKFTPPPAVVPAASTEAPAAATQPTH
jgi:TonB family protein